MHNRLSGLQYSVIGVQLAILISMAILIGPGLVEGQGNPAFAWYALLIPILVIGWTIATVHRKARILGYWGLAVLMSPLAVLGIFGGWGILYVMGIMFLLWVAWQTHERPD